jgi:alkylation response protein AidB-like acyl-CoA dehydrogenase
MGTETALAPQAAELTRRAQALAPLVSERAGAAEQQGALTDDVVEAFHRDGLFAMWVPRSLGGAELDPLPSLEVLDWVSYGDPSAGWVLMAAAIAIGVAGAYLADDAVAELFAGDQVPVIAGQGLRPGRALVRPGGYELSGEWSFGSAIRHATHVHTGGAVDGGELRIFVLPIEQVTLIDNWDVLGLRATGSLDYVIERAFVPDSYTHPTAVTSSPRGGGLYRLGIPGIAAICHSGWSCGVGRRLLEEIATLARERAGRAGQQAESDSFLESYAIAESKLRAARALIRETWAEIELTLAAGDPPSTEQQTLIRLALTNSTRSLQEIATFVYLAGGTASLRAGTIQRLFRDVHGGTQHITSSPPVVWACGRQLAGLAPGEVWGLRGLQAGGKP